MVAMLTLLIVAPSAALTASLRFVLEAENYDVTTVTSLAEAAEADRHFDCTVLDHHVLGSGDDTESISFLRTHGPVVMLANDLLHPLAKWSFRTLAKPLLGAALSQAVRDAVSTQRGRA